MSGILVVILISLRELGLVLFPKEFVKLLSGLLQLVLYLWIFRSSWSWFVVSKYLPVGLHAAEASYVSSSSISAFWAAVVRAVWSSKMPLASAPATLNLLDDSCSVFYIVLARFRTMRRYLACCFEEESRIFRMLDSISRGSQGQWSGPSPSYLCC